MKIKVLQLESWMTAAAEETMLWIGHKEYDITCSGRYQPTMPVFNRPGVYMFGGASWFERENGTAYIYDPSSFNYSMAMLNIERLNARQGQALADIVAQGLATKEQQSLLHRLCDFNALRSTHRNSMRSVLRMRKDRAI